MAEQAEYIYRILDKYSGPLSKISQRTRQFDAAIKRGQKSLAVMQKRMKAVGAASTQMGRSMMMKTTVPLTAMGILAGKTAIDIQSAFIGVQKTVQATPEQFDEMREQFKQMSKEIPVSVTELMKMGEVAGQLGIETKNITSFTKTMSMLAATTNISGEEGALALAQFANVSGMSQKDFDRLGSTIAHLGNNLQTTEADIVHMAQRLVGAGSIVGMTEAQIMSLAGAAKSVGIEAEAGGTAFSKLMLRLDMSVARGGSKLKSFAKVAGISAKDFAALWKKDAASGLITFIEGLKRLDKEGKNIGIVLEGIGIKEQRMRDSLLKAAGAGDKFRKALVMGNTAWEENTALIKEAELRFGSWASKLIINWNKVKLVLNEIGKILVPMFLSLVERLTPILEKFNSFSPTTKIIIIALLALAAVIPPLLIAFGMLAFSLSAILGIMAAPAFGTFMLWASLLVSAPVLAFAVALGSVAAAIYQIYTNWQQLTGAGAWEDFKAWGGLDREKNLIRKAAGDRTPEQDAAIEKMNSIMAQRKAGTFGNGGSPEIGKQAALNKENRGANKTDVSVTGEVGVSLGKGLKSDKQTIPLNAGTNLAGQGA